MIARACQTILEMVLIAACVVALLPWPPIVSAVLAVWHWTMPSRVARWAKRNHLRSGDAVLVGPTTYALVATAVALVFVVTACCIEGGPTSYWGLFLIVLAAVIEGIAILVWLVSTVRIQRLFLHSS